MIAWWPVVRPFVPYVAIVLAFGIAFQCGASRARGKAEARIATAEAATGTVEAERDQCREILERLRGELEESRLRVEQQHREFELRIAELQEVSDEERARLASSYARALENARAESAELRARVAGMAPGEACLEVVREVADALR